MFMKMFIVSVLNGFFFFLFIMSFHYINNHFVEVRNTRSNSSCLLKTLLSICKKQIYPRKIVRILKQIGPVVRALRLLTLQKPFKQFSLTSEFKSPMITRISHNQNFCYDFLSTYCMILHTYVLHGIFHL